MVQFEGVNHVALTVTDLDVSERFYCDVLGLTMVLDLGHGRLCLDRRSGFSVALLHPPDSSTDTFSPLRTGLDHLGLTAGSRADLEEWERRLQDAGVPYSPIQDMPLGSHLNFTDPDGIALEFQAPNDLYAAILVELSATRISDEEIRRRAAELLGG
ncbi:VOC family protein [Nakamurella deserti]|uniref:VOC family protein n=1 Tax=Nakamurella deserti TaxID=2164074 RepID=UPI000DBE209E|nr:VOC family protein [Nakamurella deserti]